MANTSNISLAATKVPARDKAEQTTKAARVIADAETAAREKKTARLKMLRMEQEAAEQAMPKPDASETKVVKAKAGKAAAKPGTKAKTAKR